MMKKRNMRLTFLDRLLFGRPCFLLAIPRRLVLLLRAALLYLVKGAAARITSGPAQFFFDAEELVVFGYAVGAREAAGLDLPGVCRHGEVCYERVFGLARAMRDDGCATARARKLYAVERLRQRADLVDLDENGIGDAKLNALPEKSRISDEEVVADELNVAAH